MLITERGKASHILMSIKEYESLIGQSKSIVDLLVINEQIDDVEFNKFYVMSLSPAELD
ncbi:hypothetical protein ACMZOO_07945 [Catenovulum sp. SX2]|uniref:hypothetical protein n=1 Tax=Catenovulum sp. SX2 TaxID=3398614 RepID=UPI003F827203